MADLRLAGVEKRYGAKAAVAALSFTVGDGELFAVLGPSGCGKTTALRIIAGFVAPDRGQVLFGGRDVTALPPERRDAAMVFQSYALFPHLDVGENVAFGLRARRAEAKGLPGRVAAALQLVDLAGYERRDVGSLSGGEQQRVALARALAVEPKVLLLDEPMSNLDPQLREATRRDLRALQRRLGITTLFVTHDQEEALEVADRVAVLAAGRLVQVGSPRELYDAPASAFVATFVGQANLLPARVAAVASGEAEVELDSGLRLRLAVGGAGHAAGDRVLVALRPESVAVGAAQDGDADLGEGTVRDLLFRGATIEAVVELKGGARVRAVALHRAATGEAEVGSRVRLRAPRARLILLAAGDAGRDASGLDSRAPTRL